jgi:hypothetical protein
VSKEVDATVVYPIYINDLEITKSIEGDDYSIMEFVLNKADDLFEILSI